MNEQRVSGGQMERGQVEGAGEAEYVDVVGMRFVREYYRKLVSGRVVKRESAELI
jgi:hypothetical protein